MRGKAFLILVGQCTSDTLHNCWGSHTKLETGLEPNPSNSITGFTSKEYKFRNSRFAHDKCKTCFVVHYSALLPQGLKSYVKYLQNSSVCIYVVILNVLSLLQVRGLEVCGVLSRWSLQLLHNGKWSLQLLHYITVSKSWTYGSWSLKLLQNDMWSLQQLQYNVVNREMWVSGVDLVTQLRKKCSNNMTSESSRRCS